MSAIFSWPRFREPWRLDVDDPMVDGYYREDLVDEEHRRIRIDGLGRWRQVILDVAASPPDDSLVPDGVHLLVSAPRTNTRLSVPLVEDGEWRGSATLDRPYLAGPVTLVVEATGRIDGRARLLGRSEEWTLVVDAGEAPTPPGAPPFAMTWVDFGAAEAPQSARRNPDAHAVMDLSTTPCLYLNDGVEGLRELLHADGAKLERRRARDMIAADVARTAWRTLLRAAVSEVEVDDDGTVSMPEDPLLRQTLSAVARVATGVSDVDELVERIAGTQGGSLTEHLDLWTDLDAAVDRLSGLPEAVESIVREARNV